MSVTEEEGIVVWMMISIVFGCHFPLFLLFNYFHRILIALMKLLYTIFFASLPFISLILYFTEDEDNVLIMCVSIDGAKTTSLCPSSAGVVGGM